MAAIRPRTAAATRSLKSESHWFGIHMSKKQNTRDRIVQSAAKLFRANGYASTGIDAIMADAGLTAGAFYSHFKSKDALFAEILPFASKQALRERADQCDGVLSLERFIDAYLSEKHRNDRGNGCPFAALGADISHASPSTRRKAQREIAEVFAYLNGELGAPRQASAPTMAMLVGAMIMSRFQTRAESARLLAECRRAARVITNGV
jgi:TetR/AcrR family transcriptional repressor of nem operon